MDQIVELDVIARKVGALCDRVGAVTWSVPTRAAAESIARANLHLAAAHAELLLASASRRDAGAPKGRDA